MNITAVLMSLLFSTVIASRTPTKFNCKGRSCISHEKGTVRSVQKRALPLKCCACGRATYKITFIGKWNRLTHPRDYPWPMARWSSLIGCSHSDRYVVWKYGGLASSGVRMISEWGATSSLEEEMKKQGRNVLSIIKAPGLWQGVGQTSTEFRADKSRHLVSVISRMAPSPDWNVGVDRLNLCTINCTWKDEEIIDLYPWDAGTDDGITFTSPNSKSVPQQPISRMTTRLHNHPMASFYLSVNDVIQPFAQLKIERLGVSGSCSPSDAHRGRPFPPKPLRVDCLVTRWSSWTSCSRTCGFGQQVRGRDIIILPMHGGIPCAPLYEQRPCSLRSCVTISTKCEVSAWSTWSPCRGTCGVGRKVRLRRIIRQSATPDKKCPSLVKKKRCRLPPCQGDKIQVRCVVSKWSPWSTCSKACRGKMIRTRQILSKARFGGRACPKLRQKRKCNQSCQASRTDVM